MITIRELAEKIGAEVLNMQGDKSVLGLVRCDSRSIQKGDVFCAISGFQVDGHNFISQAESLGAEVFIVSNSEALGGRVGLLVNDTRLAYSKALSVVFEDPSSKLLLLGVTGTSGKTTVHWLLYHILTILGKKTVRIGTIGTHMPGCFDTKEGLTSPEAFYLNDVLAKAVQNGAEAAVMEVSSHALDQARVEDLQFDGAIFTNLSRDHLDYHKDMESYFNAKKHLFSSLLPKSRKNNRSAVINIDSSWGKRLFEEGADGDCRFFSYGMVDESAKYRIVNFKQDIFGSSFNLQIDGIDFEVVSKLIGEFNAYNITSALALLHSLGFDLKQCVKALAEVPPVPGRLQQCGQKEIAVFVDYAHKPDALENVLCALRPLVNGGKLWTVFGCGGDRDRGKRPIMAEIARRLSDYVVVTSDNPRTEDPEKIIEEILSGGVKADIVNADRRQAIRDTLSRARPGDIVLIAGKGHEDYQIIGKEKRYFYDIDEVRSFFEGS
ncbi:MAG TPA: UDP-N-acetylmuramoyl-L-alanyl-D-glutamate--2,6-diaminopimelate ligase [Oligoflexia bacterium]|nr:UDP-N-acetylmuramoyl-L-alanyl-D-glutamate--2,6-diaminopimelate ligase [Oligoflexia bacterium]HMP27757.1 UDP-N-acetylmuramoyl-L-alanyl-D-glutamate--2,6-diaminopimelate ligase [Oligoflexia bacterium]